MNFKNSNARLTVTLTGDNATETREYNTCQECSEYFQPTYESRLFCPECLEWAIKASASLRLENKSEEDENGCLIWQAARDKDGYGLISYRGKSTLAHRLSYELANNTTIGTGNVVMHICDVTSCIQPAHLKEGTQAENIADMVAKGRKPQGEATGVSKLTESQVRAIRADSRKQVELAREYNVTPSTIAHIRNGTVWKHIN